MRKESEKISKHSSRCTLTEIYKKKSGSVNPAIVTFQNGELKDHRLDLSVVLTPTDSGTRVHVETSFGHVFKESHFSKKSGQNQVIAIRNRKNDKIRLVEVDSAVLINSALVTTTATTVTDAEYSKEIKKLYRTFGGKKAVSQVVKAEKLNFHFMPVADEVKQTIAELKVETDVSFNQSEVESITDLLPPCHRDSTVVSDVYQIKEILTELELESLIEEVKVMEENKFNPQEYSQFFMNCQSEAKKCKENLMVRLAGVLFAETLVKFLKIPPRTLQSKKTVICSFSTIISEKILNEFCIKKEFSVTRPQTMKDKCICYIIAVCLICCNYHINLQLLQTSVTSVNMSRLLRLARVVGAVPVSRDGHLYTLKLPLPSFPMSQKSRLRKK